MERRRSDFSVRALRIYIDRSASFRQSNQLLSAMVVVRRAVSKQRLSHWIVDAIMAAYTSQGLECPLHLRANSTRAIASSGEVCLFKIFAWQPAGLRRIPSPGFTSWTFSP